MRTTNFAQDDRKRRIKKAQPLSEVEWNLLFALASLEMTRIGLPVLLPRSVPNPPRALGKNLEHHHSCDESSHVRPERNPTLRVAAVCDRASRGAQELHHKPIAE